MSSTRRTFQIKCQDDRKLVAHWAASVSPGTTVEFRAPRRSTDQNALMWGLLTQISKQLDWYGKKRSPEDWKDLLTAALRSIECVPGIVPDTIVPLGMRTSQMTAAEVSDLIESMIAFGAERGVKFREFEEVAA